ALAVTLTSAGTRLDPPVLIAPAHEVGDVKLRLEATLTRELAARRIEIGSDRRGLVISILEAGSFAAGSASLTPPVRALILEIASAVSAIPHDVRVEGHTDNIAIATERFASNWELSTARATAVVSFLAAEGRLSPARLSAAGYGEFRPRVPNDSAAGRAQNRRVDIVVLNTATRDAEEP
ncbi:MAG TPA: OmpA family protein, partial [Vicinamibacterales bacterium]|nr:OmpA family protein [Vicinamibacterales bacterium]